MSAGILRNQIRVAVYRSQFQRQFGGSCRWLSDPVNPSLRFQPKAELDRQEGCKNTEDRNIKHLSGNETEPSDSSYDDAKLQQIIATSNMSAAKQVERERHNQIELELQRKERETQIEIERNNALKASAIKDNLEHKKAEHASEPASESLDFSLDNPTGFGSSLKVSPEATPKHPSVSKSIDLQSLKEEAAKKLHQQQEKLANWAGAKWTETQNILKNLAKSLNDATGYTGVEKHKLLVESVEEEITHGREAVKVAKAKYEQAIKSRSDSQKEINELLTRKHTWSPVDVERFTELYKNDHMNQTEEVTCKQSLEEAEQNVEAVQIKLTASILTRYHEEQLWSDKIRQASTWGTWMLMGVNIMLFATATFFVEPWKRRKLVDAFQGEVKDRMDEYSAQLQSLSQRMELDMGTLPQTQEKSEAAPSIVESLKASFFEINSWDSLRKWARDLVDAARVPGNFTVVMEKTDFAVLSGCLITFGWIFGSLINLILFSRA